MSILPDRRAKFVLLSSLLLASVSGANHFQYETLQLLEADLKALSNDDAALFGFSSDFKSPPSPRCKVFPGDTTWPEDSKWTLLNKLTGGAVIKTVPIAAPCYSGSFYNPDQCAYITSQWSNSSLHMEDPTSMMYPLYQGRTCEPPAIHPSSTGNCTIGGYPSYAINATNVAQIQLGINFARNTGIRLVIKNTGHDFSGKSGGAGALSIWTHHLKDIQFLPNYVEDGGRYHGPAFKAGSGVQAWEIYEAATEEGLVVIGGEGQTVGVMGGYIQGGGHSPLSSIHGIAADHVLSMEVVLASGQFVTASSTQNIDLFWALRGGGGSTFGVVTSVTVKAHPDIPVAVTAFSFGVGGNVTYDNFWAGIRAYFSYLIPFAEAGIYGYFYVLPGETPLFLMSPFFAPNMSVAATEALIAPWLKDLIALGINVSPQFNHFPNFISAWKVYFPQETVGQDNVIDGSRLFPRRNFETQALLNITFNEYKTSVDAGFLTINFNLAPTLAAGGYPDNSVNPAWRNTVLHSIQGPEWPENTTDATIRELRQFLTERQAAWKAITPGAGAYLGEGDRNEVDFQQSFYGTFYDRLLAIKRDIDPAQVFWAKNGVGSEGWDTVTNDVVNDENGRLCRV